MAIRPSRRSATRFRLPRRSPPRSPIPAWWRRRARRHRRSDTTCVVSVGGGAAGRAAGRRGRDAAARLAGGRRWCLITGPNLPQADFDAALGQGAGKPRDRPLPQGFPGAARQLPSCPSRRPATTPSAMSCRPAAARSWFRSRPAARPSRRCARAGCERLGLAVSLPEDALSPSSAWRGDRATAGHAEDRALAHGSTSTARADRRRCCAGLLARRWLRPPRSA